MLGNISATVFPGPPAVEHWCGVVCVCCGGNQQKKIEHEDDEDVGWAQDKKG